MDTMRRKRPTAWMMIGNGASIKKLSTSRKTLTMTATLDGSESPWIEEYDQVYAAYLDARKRFSDLKLSRGFYPIVAIGDPAAGNIAPGLLSPPQSPSKGGKGKTKKGKGGRTPSATFKYGKAPWESRWSQRKSEDYDLSSLWSTWPLCSSVS